MAVSKNWSARTINGVAGFEIIVRGEANVGRLTVLPELVRRSPQGTVSTTLLLDLLNAVDATPESFQEVQYNEKIDSIEEYNIVEIFLGNQSIEEILVERMKG